MKHQKLETTPEVSKRMANVHLKGGKAETALAKALWAEGVRYRKNYRKLPGSPDIAITKYKIAVFVDGEFWHGYDWDKQKDKIKTNRDFWIHKIERNIARDKEVTETLEADGWIVLRFWGNEISKNVGACADVIVNVLKERNRCN